MTRSTYRVVSKTSDVDESLFGHAKNKAKLRATSSQGFDVIETKTKPRDASRASSLNGSLASSAGTSSSGAGSNGSPNGSGAAAFRGGGSDAAKVLSASEIRRMKQPASALTHDEITRIRAERRDARDAERARGREARSDRAQQPRGFVRRRVQNSDTLPLFGRLSTERVSNTGKLLIPLSAYTELIKSQMLEACQNELQGRRALVEQIAHLGVGAFFEHGCLEKVRVARARVVVHLTRCVGQVRCTQSPKSKESDADEVFRDLHELNTQRGRCV